MDLLSLSHCPSNDSGARPPLCGARHEPHPNGIPVTAGTAPGSPGAPCLLPAEGKPRGASRLRGAPAAFRAVGAACLAAGHSRSSGWAQCPGGLRRDPTARGPFVSAGTAHVKHPLLVLKQPHEPSPIRAPPGNRAAPCLLPPGAGSKAASPGRRKHGLLKTQRAALSSRTPTSCPQPCGSAGRLPKATVSC